MGFVFSEDKIRKGSEPFKTGVYDFIVEDFYIAERESKSGNKYFNLNINLLEPDTNRKLFLSGFNGIYAGKINDDGTWNWKDKKGNDMPSVEQLNSFLYLIVKQAFPSNELQKKIPFVESKVKEFNKDIDVLTIKDLLGKPITLAIKAEENGYEKEGKWMENLRYSLQGIMDTSTRKTAFETSQKKPATYIEEFTNAFGEDYVEPLRDKNLIATRDKLKAFEGVDMPSAEETETTSTDVPVNNSAMDLL